jgi:hypothetical protein
MASRRRFTDLVGCRLPVQLASLGGPIGTPALAAAVSDAGGLGTIPDVVEFFYGDPDPVLVGLARAHGAVAGWQAGSAAECQAAVAAGCDFVTIQGIEAGGHVRGTQRLDEALAETLPHRVLASAVMAAERRADRPAATLAESDFPAFAALPPTRQVQGEIEAMALYAGESVDAVTHPQPAAAIVAELTATL